MNFSTRLANLLADTPHKQKDVAASTGLSESALANYKKGRKPRSDELFKLADFFGVSMEWLLNGEDRQTKSFGALDEDSALYETKEPRTGMIPVVSWAHAGEAIDYDVLPDADQVPTLCSDELAFGLKLEGDSMMPRFHEGAELVVAPSIEPYSGQYVVVRFAEHGGVLFRRLELEKDVAVSYTHLTLPTILLV